jgi:hypothetical protein
MASIGVSIVTGANDFFTITEKVKEQYDLSAWSRPLLCRTSDSPGIVLEENDHRIAQSSDRKAWLLDFAADRPDPWAFQLPREYIEIGNRLSLERRYKCKIREPWYRVPDVRQDCLMMSKRAHQFHRLILNKAQLFTTDTIYRGRMRPLFEPWLESLVASFHNSLTLLSSELEGRSYGGGVLELVPSEIARLAIPLAEMRGELKSLDILCRQIGGQRDKSDRLVEETNQRLCERIPLLRDLLPQLESARNHLRDRRFHG